MSSSTNAEISHFNYVLFRQSPAGARTLTKPTTQQNLNNINKTNNTQTLT